MIHDRCDYCRREFGWEPDAKAICVNCGLENVRPAQVAPEAVMTEAAPEAAMTEGAPERAVREPARPRRTRKKDWPRINADERG